MRLKKWFPAKALKIGLLVATGLLLANPGLSLAADNTVVSIYVDGVKNVVSTNAATVGDVLERAQVEIRQDDLVEPALSTEFTSEIFNINIYRAKPVVVVDGGTEIRTNTPYKNPKLIAERSAGLTVFPEDQYRTELILDVLDGIGMKIHVERAKPITVKIDGVSLSLRSQKATVNEMFIEKGIVVSDVDQLNVARDAAITDNMEIIVTRIGKDVVVQEEPIAFQTETIFDGNQPVGFEQVQQLGQPGKRLVTYEITHGDNQEISRIELQAVIIANPITKVIVRGSKQPAGANADAFLQLRFCESGNNYAANTGNGYYGAYQFSSGTWNSMGTGYGRADLAPPAVQDDAARRLQARAGWGQWPSCAAKLNLY